MVIMGMIRAIPIGIRMEFRVIALVAVGMALSGHPPHGSRRAVLPHRALALGSDAKPFAWVGMYDSWGR